MKMSKQDSRHWCNWWRSGGVLACVLTTSSLSQRIICAAGPLWYQPRRWRTQRRGQDPHDDYSRLWDIMGPVALHVADDMVLCNVVSSLFLNCSVVVRVVSSEITVLFRNNSAKNFPEICGRKFHETLMQLQHSNALMRSCVDGCFTKFTCLLTLCTLSRQTQPCSRSKADKQRKWRHSLRMYDWYFCLSSL